ncbi:MAG: hypothetical protein ACOCWO_01350 [Candidatus Muiribacteriaceae bacterium]
MKKNIFETAKKAQPEILNEEDIRKDLIRRMKSHNRWITFRDRSVYFMISCIILFTAVEYVSPITVFDFRPEISIYTKASVRLLWSCFTFSLVPTLIVSTGVFLIGSVRKGGEL